MRESAIVLEPIAVSAPANHEVAVLPQLILKRPALLGGVFEQRDALVAGVAEPRQLVAPIIDMGDKPGKRVAT